jgi:calcineurin-like phosphoesterase family protein
MPSPHNLRQDFVHRTLSRVLDHLKELGDDALRLGDGATAPPETVDMAREAIAASLRNETPPAGDYYSRSPVASLAQSAFDEQTDEERARMEDDEGPVVGIATSIIGRLFRPRHDFVDTPARAELGAGARTVLISDWGSGRTDAVNVAEQTKGFLRDGVPTHLVHLGDTYYSGTKREAQRNVLDKWPVDADDTRGARSWALNGNHDMYSGGHGLFEVTLADPRFALQRAGGATTSWFVLSGEDWNVVGLDTAWRHPELDVRGDQLFVEGDLGHLYGAQVAELLRCARDTGKRLLVLSHHQLYSAYDDHRVAFGPERSDTTPLQEQLEPVLDEREIDAWFWGHEHDCLAYEPFGGVRAARAIGHGGVPVIVRDTPAEPVPGAPDFVVKPTPGPDATPELRALRWEYRDYRIGADGGHWAKHGLAVLDVDGRDLAVSYVDDEGKVWLTESL